MVIRAATAASHVVAGSARATTRQRKKSSRTASLQMINLSNKLASPYNQISNRNTSAIAHNRLTSLARRQIAEHLKTDDQSASVPRTIKRANRLLKTAKTLYNAFKVARGLAVSAEIAPFLGILYVPQFLFALLFFGTYYVEKEWWFISWAIPGEKIAGLAWVVIICIGTISMLMAAFAYNTLLFKSVILVTGFICLAGYFAPYIFIIPWVFIWMIVINMTNIMNTVKAIKE